MKELPNILIVDDIPSNLTYLRIILKGVEANLIEANSGFDALKKTEGLPLALAILDVQMAGMNGYKLAIKINENRLTESVPIIFLTAAFPNKEQILSGYDAGAVDYIIKPLNRKVLTSKVNIFLLFFRQKQLIVESNDKLLHSELEIQKGKEQLQLLNHHLINAREEERAAISLIVHDELGQALTALKIDLSWVRENGEHTNIKPKLDKMIDTTNVIIRKVQRISSELHPKLLTDLGLADAIEWYCGEQRERTGINFELDLEEATCQNFQIELALFRILQEALTNVIRHASATKVIITIKHENGGTYMIISDDGIGIDPIVLESSDSMGLFGMRERARQCNGKLELEANIPSGTILKVFIPTSNLKSDENINC
jgi:signal transduction histidine kinase